MGSVLTVAAVVWSVVGIVVGYAISDNLPASLSQNMRAGSLLAVYFLGFAAIVALAALTHTRITPL